MANFHYILKERREVDLDIPNYVIMLSFCFVGYACVFLKLKCSSDSRSKLLGAYFVSEDYTIGTVTLYYTSIRNSIYVFPIPFRFCVCVCNLPSNNESTLLLTASRDNSYYHWPMGLFCNLSVQIA